MSLFDALMIPAHSLPDVRPDSRYPVQGWLVGGHLLVAVSIEPSDLVRWAVQQEGLTPPPTTPEPGPPVSCLAPPPPG